MAERTEYSNAILPSLAPEQAIDAMRDRLNNSKLLNDEIADWIRDRARAEEQYAAELEKLASRMPSHEMALGTFAAVWGDITKSTVGKAQSSQEFARKARAEIENPIRSFSSRSPQWIDVRNLHEGLTSLAKTLTEQQDNYSKLKSKKKSGSKLEAAEISVAETRSQWENQAPYAFGQFESVDEARLVLLKDSLTRLETLEADRGQAVIKVSEDSVNSILSFEPIEEIRSFAAQIVGGNLAAAAPNGPSRTTTATSDGFSDYDGRRGSTQRANTFDDSSSINSGNTPLGGPGGATKLRSRVGSIFRSNKNKQKNSPKPSSLRGPPSVGSGMRPQISPTRQQAPLPQIPAEPYVPSSFRAAPAEEPPKQAKPAPPPSRKVNGGIQQQLSASQVPGTEPLTKDEEDEDNQPLYSISSGQQQPLRVNIRQDTITEEQEDADTAMTNVATTLRARPTISGRSSRGRRDIQSRLFTGIEASNIENAISAAPPMPEMPSNAAAGQQFLSQLQTFPSHATTSDSPVEAPPQQQGSDQQILAASGTVPPQLSHTDLPPLQPPQMTGDSGSFGSSPEPSPTMAPVSNGFNPQQQFRTNRASSDVQSLRSLQSSAAPTLKHPELPVSDGLSATIVEVVNINMKDGVVGSSSAGGEIAFGYSTSAPQNTSTYIRVNNGPEVAKFVPNPGLLQQSSVDGTFRIDASTANVTGLNSTKQGVVGFKYSLKDGSKSVPVTFVPIWRIEETQSSLMLTFKLADDAADESVQLQDLVVSVPIEGGLATSAQSKPVASFNKDRQRITWRFTEPITVSKTAEERFLCRVATEGPAKEGTAGIDVRYRALSSAPLPFQLSYGSGVQQDPFGDNPESSTTSLPIEPSSWHPVVATRQIITGKYTVHSESNVQVR